MAKKEADIKGSVLLYLSAWNQLKYLNYEQKGMILERIFLYCINGKVGESDDNFVCMAWESLKTMIDINNEKWKVKAEIHGNSSRLGGIVRALKDGKTLKKENIDFLKQEGYYNKIYFEECDIPKKVIDLHFPETEKEDTDKQKDYNDGLPY